MPLIDRTTDFGKRVEKRLQSENIAWFTTVRADGMPQPIPVWYLWDESNEILIFSRPDALKLRNLRTNPKASLHFDGDGRGGDIINLSGEAQIATTPITLDRIDAYLNKYTEGIKSIGLTPETMRATFSTALIFRPQRLTGH